MSSCRAIRFTSILCVLLLIGGTTLNITVTAADSVDQVYRSVSGGRPFIRVPSGAIFQADGHQWAIVGAEQQPTNLVTQKGPWSVETPYEVLIVREPISNEKILPYSDPVPNTVKGDTLRIKAAGGEREPASFVLRSGEAPLEDVRVKLGTFNPVSGGPPLALNTDIRVVKVWYQAATGVSRKNEKKVLTPELLLRDSDLVRVDHKHQVNLIRDWHKLEDAPKLLPFDVQAHNNQQLWLLFNVPKDASAGTYRAPLSIEFTSVGSSYSVGLNVEVEVLPFTLPETPLDNCLYYLSSLLNTESPAYEGKLKNGSRIEQDFRNMREHGLTNIAMEFPYRRGLDGKGDFSSVAETLRLFRNAGFDTSQLLYIDWHLSERDDLKKYKEKVVRLIEVAKQHGFNDVYVYGPDEAEENELRSSLPLLRAVHEAGAKNYFATRANYAEEIKGLIDVAIINRNSNPGPLREKNITVWAYASPQAGEEKPATYRDIYGIRLWLDGFDGACNYAYQSSNNPYNDWASDRWRPHNMTYPSMSGPISTVQWEGWREGVDDMRYLSIFIDRQGALMIPDYSVNRRGYLAGLLESSIPKNPAQIRDALIKKIVSDDN